MPKPVLTLTAAWAAFDAGVFDIRGDRWPRAADAFEALSDELRRFAEEVEAGRAWWMARP
jgi:hypothetical protein